MAALSPTAILATAILWIVEANPSLFFSELLLLILFDMKYERFKEWLNFGLVVS
jgi:hypothetical protein